MGTALDLVAKHGDDLIGRRIVTRQFGDWPGGEAIITEMGPDPNAPEIAFMVRGDDGLVNIAMIVGALDSAEIGVFEYEEVSLVE